MWKKEQVYKHHNRDGTITSRTTVTKRGKTETRTTRESGKKKHKWRWIANPFLPNVSDQELEKLWIQIYGDMAQEKKLNNIVSKLNGTNGEIENLVIDGIIK